MDDDPATEILEATYRALYRHGYADLTVKDIADETDRSTASIHYYYGSKETLFTEFLDFLYDRYTTQLATAEGNTPPEQLATLLEATLVDEPNAGSQLRTAMLGMYAQAQYNDAIQDRLAKFDEYLFDRIETIVADGIDTGHFDDSVDPTVAAEFLVTAITGTQTRRATIGHSPECVYETVTDYTETQLIADSEAGAVA
jgi:TetR/AcrR family transcriptional repressor of nem operon